MNHKQWKIEPSGSHSHSHFLGKEPSGSHSHSHFLGKEVSILPPHLLTFGNPVLPRTTTTEASEVREVVICVKEKENKVPALETPSTPHLTPVKLELFRWNALSGPKARFSRHYEEAPHEGLYSVWKVLIFSVEKRFAIFVAQGSCLVTSGRRKRKR